MEEMEHEGSKVSSSFVLTAKLKLVGEDLETIKDFSDVLNVKLIPNSCKKTCLVELQDNSDVIVFSVRVTSISEVFQCGSKCIQLRDSQGSALLTFDNQNDTSTFLNQIHQSISPGIKRPNKQSVFSLRTEDASANQYFQFYGFLSQQQNMMQDYVRTSTYQSAMLQNTADFSGKVVIDVGAGSGILSFFAIQAGAKKVYAVEASSMAVHCQRLMQANNLSKKVTVIAGKIEEVDIPEKVDVIISEPMGYMLFNERMLETYLHARKWLKPNGKMFPTKGILYCAPFTDELLYLEQCTKASFWSQQHFHGVDVSSLKEAALDEYFGQPIVDTFDVRILVARPVSHSVDFLSASEASLHLINIPLSTKILTNGYMHGIAFWFDILFDGSQQAVWLSTSPSENLTHWYQIRCLLKKPIFCGVGQELTGSVRMMANERQSYDVDIKLELAGTSVSSHSKYDLKNPFFRYTSTQQIIPGSHHTNPTETYLSTLQTNNAQTVITNNQLSQIPPLMNGGNGELPPPNNPPYMQYQNNMNAFSTTSVYGQPLMTPGTTREVPSGGRGSELWFPEQSNAYEPPQMYYPYNKPATNNPKGIGYQNMIHSHS